MPRRTVEIVLLGKDEFSRTLSGISGKLGGFGRSLAMVGTVGVGAIGAIGAAATKLAYDAAQVEPIRISFENLSESINETADSMLNALRPATMGTLSDVQLMEAANKLMAMGLANSAEEAAALAEMATTLGTAMGEDATASLENFTLMLANQSIPRLDTFGISSGQVRERIEELMEATEGLTREQAFMQAVMEIGTESMDRVGDISGTSAVAMSRFQATIKNVKDSVGQALLPVLNTLVERVLTPLAERLLEMAPAIQEGISQAVEQAIPIIENMITIFVNQVIPTLQNLAAFVLPILQRAIQFVVDNWRLFAAIAAVVGVAVLAITHPIALLVAAIGLLATAWANNWGGIQDKVRAVWNFIKPVFDAIGAAINWIITNILPPLREMFANVWSFIQQVVIAAWQGIQPHLEELQAVLAEFWQEIQPRLQAAWTAIQNAMRIVQEWVIGTLIPALQNLWDRLEPVREIIVRVAGAFASFMASAFVNSLKVWLQGIIGLWDAMSSAISTVIGWIQQLLGWIQDAIDAWNRLGAVGAGGGGGLPRGRGGVHQAGLAFVPTTPYWAMLHRGEAVLTRGQAERWRAQRQAAPSYTIIGNIDSAYGIDGIEEALDDALDRASRHIR